MPEPLSHMTSTGRGVQGLHAYAAQGMKTLHTKTTADILALCTVHFECITDINPQGSGSEKETDKKKMPLGRESEGRKTLWHTWFLAWQS